MKTIIGLDLAVKPKWWQKILSFLGFSKWRSDYSCMVVFEKKKNGEITFRDINYF